MIDHLDSDSAERYVAGTLTATEAEAFEPHLIACAACQDRVRFAASMRHALRREPRASRPRARSLAGAAALAAAVVVAITVWRGRSALPLADLRPPEFIGVPARAASDSSSATVARAMAAYAAGDFRDAARHLGVVARSDSSPAVAYYLGVALLQTRDAAGAIAAARRAQMPSANPYADDARIVAAKAWLLAKRADSALAELSSAGSASTHARALSDSIRRLVR